MRSHGGGWHANTAKVCFGLSIIYYLTVVFVSERLPDTFDNLRFMALISAIIILLSPVDSINKPLDSEQRKIEKKKPCRYVVAIYCISLILKWNSLTCYVKEINISLFIVLCSMIFGIESNTKCARIASTTERGGNTNAKQFFWKVRKTDCTVCIDRWNYL